MKREANCVFFFLLTSFFSFFLLVWHVLSCLSFCFARVIFLSFSAQREIHLAHMTTTAAAARQQQQPDEHKLQNGCQRNQKEKQGEARGPEGLKEKARQAEEEKAPNSPSYSREHREKWRGGGNRGKWSRGSAEMAPAAAVAAAAAVAGRASLAAY